VGEGYSVLSVFKMDFPSHAFFKVHSSDLRRCLVSDFFFQFLGDLWSEPLDFIQESVESVFGRRRTMRPSRFSEEQIIAILKEQEAGAKTAEVCRRHGISDASFYKWKAKYGGLDVSEAKRLKVLEDENAKLKKLLAEAMLDNAMLKDIAAKKW